MLGTSFYGRFDLRYPGPAGETLADWLEAELEKIERVQAKLKAPRDKLCGFLTKKLLVDKPQERISSRVFF